MDKLFLGHHKCATGWIAKVLINACAVQSVNFKTLNTRETSVCVDGLVFNGCSDYHHLPDDFKAVHIIRDIRDLLVSGYYSHIGTHPTAKWPQLEDHRKQLKTQTIDDGLCLEYEFLQDQTWHDVAAPPLPALKDWNYKDDRILTIKMEDLTANPLEQFTVAFEFLNLEPSFLEEILKVCTFEELSGGREKGDIDDQSHYRSGKPGTWRKTLLTSGPKSLKLLGTIHEEYGDYLSKHNYIS